MIEALRPLKLEKLAVVKQVFISSYSGNDLKLIVRYIKVRTRLNLHRRVADLALDLNKTVKFSMQCSPNARA